MDGSFRLVVSGESKSLAYEGKGTTVHKTQIGGGGIENSLCLAKLQCKSGSSRYGVTVFHTGVVITRGLTSVTYIHGGQIFNPRSSLVGMYKDNFHATKKNPDTYNLCTHPSDRSPRK